MVYCLHFEEIPVVLSKPHFLDGDESLRTNVKGMKPNREIHDFFIDVEPVKTRMETIYISMS